MRNDKSDALKRYREELEVYYAARELVDRHLGHSVPRPGMLDIEEVLTAYAFATKLLTSLSDPVVGVTRVKTVKKPWSVTIQVWAPGYHSDTGECELVIWTASGETRSAAVAKAYGKARQLLQSAELEPPDPSRFQYSQYNPMNPRRPAWRPLTPEDVADET